MFEKLKALAQRMDELEARLAEPGLYDDPERAAKLLKEDEYEILMLCQVAGYRRREVAQMLGMPIGTVTWKNNEALKKLKAHLKKEGGR